MNTLDTILGWLSLLGLLTYGVLKVDQAFGAELYLLEPTYLTMESWKIRNKVDPYTNYDQPYENNGREKWAYGAAVRMNANLVRVGKYSLYTRNHWHMNSTEKQVRTAAWEWDNGLDLGNVELFYRHHSQHVLDTTGNGAYPLEDYIGVRFVFLDKGVPQ